MKRSELNESALPVILVELVMCRLQSLERVELEAHSRVARGHHLVRDEFLRISEVTGEAQLRTRDVVGSGIHAAR